ncbi:MAG: ABC transporter permease subunit [Desulfovermiculus sp.]|nr:ABC transporter permease subunit [Desulfovermiculus sp.]
MNYALKGLQELRYYPSAVLGLAIVGILIAVSVYTVFIMPLDEAVRLWRAGEGVWAESPRNASPWLLNLWPGNNYPETIVVQGGVGQTASEMEQGSGGVGRIRIQLPFTFDYDGFPKDIQIFYHSQYEKNPPHATFTWHTPDGRKIDLGSRTLRQSGTYSVTQNHELAERLERDPRIGLFYQPGSKQDVPLKGEYELVVQGYVFEPESSIEVKAVAYGQVHGLTGTDHRRRSLTVALLWGTPVALAFGVLAALGSTLSTLVIASIGVWFGGWVDAAIQRITELNAILPVLPLLVLIGTLYSRSIWVMLGVVILLGIFSLGIKVYRAMLLPIKNAPYIEAARAYGAGNMRIVFFYLTPRVVPVIVPQLVTLIPTFVFLEATLALLGLGDPLLPTWGKVLQDAFQQGALYKGYYYWVLGPAFLLMLTGLGFAMVGFALDRIFNPRLRGY